MILFAGGDWEWNPALYVLIHRLHPDPYDAVPIQKVGLLEGLDRRDDPDDPCHPDHLDHEAAGTSLCRP
jgi:hypothetical protein